MNMNVLFYHNQNQFAARCMCQSFSGNANDDHLLQLILLGLLTVSFVEKLYLYFSI